MRRVADRRLTLITRSNLENSIQEIPKITEPSRTVLMGDYHPRSIHRDASELTVVADFDYFLAKISAALGLADIR